MSRVTVDGSCLIGIGELLLCKSSELPVVELACPSVPVAESPDAVPSVVCVLSAVPSAVVSATASVLDAPMIWKESTAVWILSGTHHSLPSL